MAHKEESLNETVCDLMRIVEQCRAEIELKQEEIMSVTA